MSEAEIQEKKKKLSDARSKLEHLKEEVIAELQQVLPTYLERKVNDVIRDNPALVFSMPKDRLRRLKESIDAAIPEDVKDGIDAVRASDTWFKCGKIVLASTRFILRLSGRLSSQLTVLSFLFWKVRV